MGSIRDEPRRPPSLRIHPPLANSATPWATTLKDLNRLYSCPHTGAVTTRTSLIHGFPHDPEVHQHALYDTVAVSGALPKGTSNASFNSLGYSPLLLSEYLNFIEIISLQQKELSANGEPGSRSKTFIISVTGTPQEIVECYHMVSATQAQVDIPLALELNLSCPNIPGKPPPAYDGPSLLEYITWLSDLGPTGPVIAVGIKTPPYTHSTQYETLISALIAGSPTGLCPISFITSTNTLGSCLMLTSLDAQKGQGQQLQKKVLPGNGLGGMAGTPLHPLSLGNVATIRRLLDEQPDMLGHIQIIGVGGVCDSGGYRRMRSVGAAVVGVGTGLGVKGVKVFEDIAKGVHDNW
ncbi:hypothetical protein PpBr36_01903 [Pyricularia pennisetigena]|uniref:hypothetical protein n=1 Tax=Pyricularia pennisetigena TaxID=1578925 RepID=UPI00114F2B00|nr:hypothetical protein PpBr36_01903 [Pyricularia pennisetigena]TLS28455.1 hypothetical protein PpBr36_01903 [Pyricularia pennisetigena]